MLIVEEQMFTVKVFQPFYFIFENFHNKILEKKLIIQITLSNRNIMGATNLSHKYIFTFSVAILKNEKNKQVKLMLIICYLT